MKKFIALLFIAALLTGCAAQETFETVDDNLSCVTPDAKEVLLTLPDEASVMAFESNQNDKLYICDGYTVSLSVTEAGDISKTLQQVTGFPKEQLRIVETTVNDIKRYDGVWTCMGEEGEQVGNVTVLDDGAYHYVLSILGDASIGGKMSVQWNNIKQSFGVIDTAQARFDT